MYQLVEIIPYMMTRDVLLKNLETGLVEKCFDDSEISDNNFGFMQVGHRYNCKILLFGDLVPVKTEKSVTCQVVNWNAVIGRSKVAEVRACGGTYYINKKQVQDFLNQKEFEFEFTRKDLIQVDNAVHADLLRDKEHSRF